MFPSTVSPERKMMPFGPLRANMSLHKWSEFSFMLIALAFEKSLANTLSVMVSCWTQQHDCSPQQL